MAVTIFSSTAFVIIFIISIFTPTSAFLPGSTLSSLAKQRSSRVQMNASPYGSAKLGQSVITSPGQTQTSQDQMFRRVPVGSGTDERFSSAETSEEALAESHSQLMAIGKSIKVHSLLLELQGERWSEAEKLHRISMATDILPTHSAANLHAGGLFNDWEFDL